MATIAERKAALEAKLNRSRDKALHGMEEAKHRINITEALAKAAGELLPAEKAADFERIMAKVKVDLPGVVYGHVGGGNYKLPVEKRDPQLIS